MKVVQKKWFFCCSLMLIIFSLPAYTQIDINGRVVDEKSDSPLPGANIYFNNTTIGTNTNEEGIFRFEAIHLMNTDLVISCPGYDILVYRPKTEQVEGKRIVFKLRARQDMQKSKLELSADLRKKCLEIFYKSLLGITKEALKCKIANPENIYFTAGENNTSFMAYADTPLVIINNALGYKLRYDLLEFSYDDATDINNLAGFTHFSEEGDEKKWIKNRQNAYYGSTLHFYRSLIRDQLYEQGFGTFLVQPAIDSALQKTLNPEQLKAASLILKTAPISARQILHIDSANNIYIGLQGKLLVQYSSDPSSKQYLKRNIYIAGDLDKGVESYILFKASSIGLNMNGVLSDATSVEYSGYWIYEKAANSLPYDYQPDQ